MLYLSAEQIIGGVTIESQRLEYKEGWNPEDIIHTITAFANDFHNEGGGYIIIGVEENDGIPIRPVKGLIKNQLDGYQKQYLNLINSIRPNYTPSLSVEAVDGANIIIIKCYQGDSRPYDCPVSLSKKKSRREYYIRKAANSVIAKSSTDRARLESFRNFRPFDERLCYNCNVNDLDINIIKAYLESIKSPLLEDTDIMSDKYKLLECLDLTCHPKESLAVKNAAILMFSENPHKIFPSAKIDIIHFNDDSGKDFVETTFFGPIHKLIEKTLNYLKSRLLETQVSKSLETGRSTRYDNYPYIALREVIANAFYHQGYDQHRNPEMQIFSDRIEVVNYPAPLPPVNNNQLQNDRVSARDYRNVKIGELLKDYGLTEKKATGFPTIRKALRSNSSPEPFFEMDDNDRTYFKATIYIHQDFLVIKEPNLVVDILSDNQQQIIELCLDIGIKKVEIQTALPDLKLDSELKSMIEYGYIEVFNEEYKATKLGRDMYYRSY